MSQRFFVEVPITTDRVCLQGDEAHHLTHVMRVAIGQEVILFDGSGREFVAQVTGVQRRGVTLAMLAQRAVDRELASALVLGVALPKGDRQRWLVEKAVELGVTRLVPLTTTRGVAQPSDRTLERLRRAVVEASKQCGRNRLLQIDAPEGVGEFVADAPGTALRLLAHPAADAGSIRQIADHGTSGDVYAAVGPEGGFTEEELAAAHDWPKVSLGPRILRVETAAVALAAWFSLNSPSTDSSPRPANPDSNRRDAPAEPSTGPCGRPDRR